MYFDSKKGRFNFEWKTFDFGMKEFNFIAKQELGLKLRVKGNLELSDTNRRLFQNKEKEFSKVGWWSIPISKICGQDAS